VPSERCSFEEQSIEYCELSCFAFLFHDGNQLVYFDLGLCFFYL
jgi:hypothetical protein